MSYAKDKAKIKASIKRHGAKEFKELFYRGIGKMVNGHQLAYALPGIESIHVGFENMDCRALEMCAECLIEFTTNLTDKAKIQKVYDYWKTNRTEILRLHCAQNC